MNARWLHFIACLFVLLGFASAEDPKPRLIGIEGDLSITLPRGDNKRPVLVFAPVAAAAVVAWLALSCAAISTALA